MKLILSIDGGGTRTRCVAIDADGNTLGSGESGPSNHLLVERATVRGSLSQAIDRALAASGKRPEEILCVVAGLAGVDYDGKGADEMHALFGEIGYGNTVIEGDMVIAHVGALAGEPGVLALAGTGSSVLGVGEDGTRVKVGGWGPVFGDEGSAYRIGQAALRAAARDFDERGPKTELTAAVVNELGISDFKESIEAVYLDEMQPREIAGLSKTVYRIAGSGDETALNIFKTAGMELAECVTAAIRRLGFSNGKIRVSFQGSVITSCEFMRESFCGSLYDKFPDASVIPPRFPPVIGAYLLSRTAFGLANDEKLLSTLDKSLSEL